MTPDHASIDVWHVPLDVTRAEERRLLQTLAADERARARRMAAPQARRYVAARGALRAILAGRLGAEPARITLAVHPGGKPHLPDHPSLQFNLSHSGDACVCAVAASAVGVDIEQVRPMDDLLLVARRFFAPGEYEAIARLPAARQPSAFFACWTRKEAFVKALGAGLQAPLHRFEVSVDPAAPALRCSDLPGGEPVRWQLRNLATPPGYAGSLAATASCRSIVERAWRWTNA